VRQEWSSQADELFDRIREVCPTFVPYDDHFAYLWRDEPHQLSHVRMAGVAEHLTQLAQDDRWDLVTPVLDLVEGAFASFDPYTQDVVRVSLIEQLRRAGALSSGGATLEQMRAHLGPALRDAWDSFELSRVKILDTFGPE
jgi:hypothetical protein